MKTIPRLLLSCLFLVALSGCLQIDTLITVRADGSGTVRETVRLSEETVEMIRQMEEMAGGQTGGGIIDREELQRRATAMGPGVSFESVEEIPGSGGFGYEAVWAFEDINTLRVEQNAESAVPQPGVEPTAEDSADNPAATFRLEPGTPAVLHVTSTLAGGDTAEADSATPPGEPQVPPEMLREMFAGMRFSIAVEVEGAIVETNASHRVGPRVTLFELDFDRLLQDPKAIALMAATDAPDPMQLKDALRGIPGIKVETETDLRVAFVPSGAGAASMAAATDTATEVAADAAAAVESAAASVAQTAQQAVATVSETANAAADAVVEAMPAVPETTAAAAMAETGAAPTVPETTAAAAMAETGAAPAMAETAVPAASMPATTTAMAPATPLGTIAGYSWRSIDVGELASQRFKLVALIDAAGSVTKGMVMQIQSGRVTVRRASMDGGGTVELPLSTLRAASVFELGS